MLVSEDITQPACKRRKIERLTKEIDTVIELSLPDDGVARISGDEKDFEFRQGLAQRVCEFPTIHAIRQAYIT
ncbi:hypothetical protein D3C71_2071730 [compost metagenome]